MPKFEIELDDKGEFLGTVPPEFDSVLTRIKTTSHGEGYGKGAAKAAEEAKQQIAEAIKAAKLKMELDAPMERAKFDEIDTRNKQLTGQVQAMAQEHQKTLTQTAETHAVEITKRAEALTKRNQKIQTLVNAHLRALAAQAGARDESLSELEVILQHRIGFTDDMEPYVKGEDGQPAKTTAGNALPIDVFVKQYLDNHSHHRKPAPGKGGDARRGASLSGHQGIPSVDAAGQRIDQGDHSSDAINDLYLATRKKTA